MKVSEVTGYLLCGMILAAGILFLFFIENNALAEDVTITTYYPAPYGVYEDMVVTNRLGIGTTGPETGLDVYDNTSVTSFTGDNNQGVRIIGSNSANRYTLLGFAGYNYPATNANLAQIGAKMTTSGSYLYFGTSNTYSSAITNEAMVINYDGYVGIGTTDPGRKLHVYKSTNDLYVKAETDGGNAYFEADGTYNSGLKMYDSGDIKAYVYWNGYGTDNYLSLYESGQDRLVIKGGNVGIGTTDPSYDLHIYGSGSALRLEDPGTTTYAGLTTAGSDPRLELNRGGTSFFIIRAARISEVDYLRFEYAGSDLVSIHSNGSVGIKVSADPNYALNVNGDARIGWHGSSTRIKILPSDFMSDDDGGGDGTRAFDLIAYDDDESAHGVMTGEDGNEMFAFVPIPTGYKATDVRVYASNIALSLKVFESSITNGSNTPKGTGTTGAELDITDVSSTSTNFLVIEVDTTDGYFDGTSGHRIYGGYVTIAPI